MIAAGWGEIISASKFRIRERRKMKVFRTVTSIFLLMAWLGLSMGWSQANGERLILKDGSYQIITKYEIKGEVVRYFSAERGDWEEIPASQVDWAATAKWKHDYGAAGNADQVTTQTTGQTSPANPNDPMAQEEAKIDAEERAARTAELARMPFVLPGLRLPDGSGGWGMDTYDGGRAAAE